MPDIRLNSGVKDDFDRANENPILGPTGVEWSQTEPGAWGPGTVRGNSFTVGFASSTNVNSYWNQETYDGDDAQVWAYAEGGGVISGLGYRLALWANPGNGTTDGYVFGSDYFTGTDIMSLGRVDNGVGNYTQLDTLAGNIEGRFALLRRNGNDVEVWQTDDQADPESIDTSSWSMILNTTSTTYTTGLYLALGIADNSGNGEGSWDYFGGGPESDWIPQFIRRPWRYKGRPLKPNV